MKWLIATSNDMDDFLECDTEQKKVAEEFIQVWCFYLCEVQEYIKSNILFGGKKHEKKSQKKGHNITKLRMVVISKMVRKRIYLGKFLEGISQETEYS